MNNAAQICKLCGSIDHEMLYEASGYPIMQCRKCGLAFTGIVPTEAVGQYYHTQYFASAHAYADDLMRQTEADPNPDYRERVRQVAAQARRASGNVLDVGCAAGTLLAAFKRAGWHCVGIEPSIQMADYARRHVGCDVHEGMLETSSLQSESFDVVTAVHVLEHSQDPGRFISCCRRLLKKGGLLLVEVPDFGSRQAIKQGCAWIPLYPDTHRYHFSSKTLSRLLQGHGFRVLRIRRYGGIGNIGPMTPSKSEITRDKLPKAHAAARRLMSCFFEHREKFFKLPGLKQLIRYVYWHLFRMNEYLRVYAVRTN